MAILIQISSDGTYRETLLQKKITTLGPQAPADIVCKSSPSSFYQILENNHHYQILGITPKSYIQHEGKKKKNLMLSDYDSFEIDKTKFIFSKKSFTPQPPSSATLHYETLYQFTKALSETKSSKATLETLLDLILKMSRSEKGFLVSRDLTLIACRSLKVQDAQETLDNLSQTILAKVKESKKPVIIDNISTHPNFKMAASIHRLQLSSLACFPWLSDNELLGYLYLGSNTAEGFFDPTTVKTIEVLLAQAALIFKQIVSLEQLEAEKKSLKAKLHGTSLIGASPGIEEVFQKIEKISPLDFSVLIVGETGTGKELIARAIHEKSSRENKPFVAINCGAIPENLLESVLFGHIKGAFTGATCDQMGKFEAAHGGTLFLDEIGEMSMHLQVKLLRVLQERTVEKIGDLKSIPIDVRVISATHQNLEKMISENRFRQDLYYRLNELYLVVPPLRDRNGDIVLLAQFFLEKHSAALGHAKKTFSQEALEKLLTHPWPGNVRELENVVKRSLIFSTGSLIEADHIDILKKEKTKRLPLREARDEFIQNYVQKVISLHNGNKEKAARELNISVRTLFRIEKNDKSDTFDTLPQDEINT